MAQDSDEFTVDMLVEHARGLFEANKDKSRETYGQFKFRLAGLIKDAVYYDMSCYSYKIVNNGKVQSFRFSIDFTLESSSVTFYRNVFDNDEILTTNMPIDQWLKCFIDEVNKISGYHIDERGKSITITSDASGENPLKLITWTEIIEIANKNYEEFTKQRCKDNTGIMKKCIAAIDKFIGDYEKNGTTSFTITWPNQYYQYYRYYVNAGIHEHLYKIRPDLICEYDDRRTLTIMPRTRE
jgi:hypothetical protein